MPKLRVSRPWGKGRCCYCFTTNLGPNALYWEIKWWGRARKSIFSKAASESANPAEKMKYSLYELSPSCNFHIASCQTKLQTLRDMDLEITAAYLISRHKYASLTSNTANYESMNFYRTLKVHGIIWPELLARYCHKYWELS